MKTSHTILSVFSLAALAGSVFLGACASDDSSSSATTSVTKDAGPSLSDATTPDAGNPVTPDLDGGTRPADAGPRPRDGGNPPRPDGGNVGQDAGCTNVFIPRVRDAGGIFCSRGGADASSYCESGETCCVTRPDGGRDQNACTTSAACSFDAGAVRAFSCTQASDCTGGSVCCAIGATEPKAQCNFDQATNQDHKGTACKASCQAGEQKVCNADTDCPTGQTCRATTIFGTYIGTCR